jgi:hypothetical protein
MTNFFNIMKTVMTDILQAFQLPIGISYWDFIIYMGFACIVIVALVNKLPLRLAGRSMTENASNYHSKKTSGDE